MDSELTNIAAVKALDQGVATTDSPTFAAITVTGNVDGRDVSVDGAKLDTIETNADVTDTANVTAAGALMDSELTDIASVKALNQGVATTDSPSFSKVSTGDGTAAAPAIIFTSDTDTGLYRSAADELGISTGGVERMRIDNSGNVGIGKFSPSTPLDVNGDVTITDKIIHSGDNTSIRFPANDTFTVETAGSERMRITSNGNVGINTAGPSSKLEVKGDVTITDKIIHSGDTNTSIRFPANDTFTVETAGSERMRIKNNGNVGIGTTSPSEKLDVNGTIRATSITVTGNVDGRDVSVDGAKLDTIETNADVTDTANVTAAGALMDSELTDIASVKALDQGVATTDSPEFAGVYIGGNAAANLLDLYEEGSWTPNVTSASGTTGTFSTYTGTYTRIGNLVTLNCYITGTNMDYTTFGAYIVLSGLPYNPAADASGTFGTGGVAGALSATAIVRQGSNDVLLTGFAVSGTTHNDSVFTVTYRI